MSQTPPPESNGKKGKGKEKEMVHSSERFDKEAKDYIDSRIHELERKLKSAKNEDERKNIRAALEIYRQRNIPGRGMFSLTHFQDGRIVPLDELDFDRPFIREVRSLTYSTATQFVAADCISREW
jgi:hypothetical protein